MKVDLDAHCCFAMVNAIGDCRLLVIEGRDLTAVFRDKLIDYGSLQLST